MDEADYELLPHQVLNDLKQDLDALKKRLSQPDARMNELLLEMESLKDNIHQLTAIFQNVLDGTKVEDPSKSLRALIEKTEALTSQNETIARGMIALSDKLSEFMARQNVSGLSIPSGSSLYSVQHTMGAPATPSRFAPRPSPSLNSVNPPPSTAPSPPPDFDLPPPPPINSGSKKRVGVFQ